MAPVTLPASEHDSRIARCALVDRLRDALRLDLPVLGRRRQPGDLDRDAVLRANSFAAASAPVRAERKTGLVELLAIIAILSPRLGGRWLGGRGLRPAAARPQRA